jgi:Na+-driven multidrug efflux pump
MNEIKEEKSQFTDIPGMFEGPLLPVMIRLAVPMLAGMVVQLLYNITDTVFISRINMSDPSIVGGVGIIFPIMFLAMALAGGLMTGVSSMVARAIGEKNYDILGVVAESGMAIALFFATITVIISYVFDDQLMALLGATGDYATVGLAYLHFVIPRCCGGLCG